MTTSARAPAQFDEFFELGLEETASPFLRPTSRKWGENLPLKASLAAAFLLVFSFFLHLHPTYAPLSNVTLLFVYFLAGIPSLIEAIEDSLNFEINIDVLMTLAAFGSVLIGSSLEGGLLLVLFSLSGAIEEAVTTKAKGAISSLKKIAPSHASVVQESGEIIERALEDIPVGTKILVRSGAIVPLDGIVLEGTSSLNLAHLTGEPLPVTKTVHDEVPAGAHNLEGSLLIKITRTNADSTLMRMIALVTKAQEAKPKLQRWLDTISTKYATTIILLSFLFAIAMPFFLGIPYLGSEGSVYRALAFLIAASPCALIMSIPVAYLSAVSACAKKGVLIKGGITLDALALCQEVAFDKTGTLTTGKITCLALTPLRETDDPRQNEALAVAAALEQNAVHPIAKGIIAYSKKQQVLPASLTHFRSVPGYGLEGRVGDTYAFIGNPDFIREKVKKEDKVALDAEIEKIQAAGEIIAILLFGDEVWIFRFIDEIRPEVKEMITRLKATNNISLVMLTGDHEGSAKRIAEQLGIKKWLANLKPEDKLNYISLESVKFGLAMCGDGVNDAPALARATVGISMGQAGSSATIEAADIVLLQDNLGQLDWVLRKAKQTTRIVKQNLIIATAAILLAAVPALLGFVPLWIAVVMHEGGTVLVGMNALRLLRC